MSIDKNTKLKNISKILRKDIVEQVYCAGSGHIGGSLSIADIMSFLFFEFLQIDPESPKHNNRDRFVLSKGHCSPALYAVLAEKGYFDKALLKTFRQTHSILEGHPSMKHVPGVEISTGSLGQGFAAAAGMAMAGKLDNLKYKVVTILGDGEVQEGEIWETAMSAPNFKLDNLIAVLDYNGLQIDGEVQDIMDIAPIDEKFKAFNWNVITIDGHNFDEIRDAFEQAKQAFGKPTMILAKTIKGKGVSFMENQVSWHGTAPKEQEFLDAMKELENL